MKRPPHPKAPPGAPCWWVEDHWEIGPTYPCAGMDYCPIVVVHEGKTFIPCTLPLGCPGSPRPGVP